MTETHDSAATGPGWVMREDRRAISLMNRLIEHAQALTVKDCSLDSWGTFIKNGKAHIKVSTWDNRDVFASAS